MIVHSALLRACAEYARTIIPRHHDIDAVLTRLAEQVTDTLRTSGGGVWLGEEGRLRLVAATGSEATAVEAAQLVSSEGPGFEAWRTGGVVAEPDLDRSQRWPAYTAAALAAGQRAVAGVPMAVGDRCIGAVDVYHTHAYAWPQEDLDTARVLADLAAGYVVVRRQHDHHQEVTAQLQHALSSRVLIEQAKGILAERHGIAVEAAFDQLRRHARSQNRRLHDAARAVVEGTLDPMAERPGG